MDERIRSECNAAFQRFLRSQELELDPASNLYEVLESVFTAGFSEGGQYGAQRVSEEMKLSITKVLAGSDGGLTRPA